MKNVASILLIISTIAAWAGEHPTAPLLVAQFPAANPSASAHPNAKPTPGAPAIGGPFAELITGDWASSEFKGLPFVLYAGIGLDPAKKYPLVVALHGKSQNNENGGQVTGWMKSFTTPERYAKNPCIIIAPLCYQPFGGTGGGWGDKPGTQTIALVKELLRSLPVDKSRIYAIGHSMGGFGVCHLINSEPRLFAAGVPVSGCGGVPNPSIYRRSPVWLFHAADDSVVKVDGSRNFAKALDRVKACKYTEYPSGGHGIAGQVFDDAAVHEWIFAQKR
ncbi:MAG: prolyl oligopeptidase family serine peptidase [Chthoniobacteraceae bacterium]